MQKVVIQLAAGDVGKVFMADDVRAEMEVDTAFAVDAELKRKGAQYSDKSSDDFVNWNFRRTWRRGKVRKNAVFGTDYDYFTTIAEQAKALFESWAPAGDPDVRGHNFWGGTGRSYRESLGLWEGEGKGRWSRRAWGQPLSGPVVRIGPTVEYALFLEDWATNKDSEAYSTILQRIGVLHAIAAQLNYDWRGAHHIYAMATKPNDSGDLRNIARRRLGALRKNPTPGFIELFPIIHIQTRHR